MRLDKYLAETAQCTRSEAKALLAKGRVTVNGAVCKKVASSGQYYNIASFSSKAQQSHDHQYSRNKRWHSDLCPNPTIS